MNGDMVDTEVFEAEPQHADRDAVNIAAIWSQ